MPDVPPRPLLSVDRLACHFPVRGLFGRRIGTLPALDDVSFSVGAGETLGIVGESGSGKSTLGKTLAGIHDPTHGTISFAGERIAPLGRKRPLAVRARLQYVYQDPGASLDPLWTLRRSLHEPLIIHTDWPHERREAKVREIATAIGLPEAHLDLQPHEISGGQLRRVGLARILVLNPDVIIFDEPTSGLDVSVQATVLALLRDLRRAFRLTYLFISHDLAVVGSMCDRVAVMYLGRIVEIGPTEEILTAPRHPYTRALLAASPRIGRPRASDAALLLADVADMTEPSSGCRYRPRCPIAAPSCALDDPPLDMQDGHGVACPRWREPGDRAGAAERRLS